VGIFWGSAYAFLKVSTVASIFHGPTHLYRRTSAGGDILGALRMRFLS